MQIKRVADQDMMGIIKTKTSEDRLTVRLTREQQKFRQAHTQLNFSEVVRSQLDKFIETFNEEEYRKITDSQ